MRDFLILLIPILCVIFLCIGRRFYVQILENNRKYKERQAKRAAEEARLDRQAEDKWDAFVREKRHEGPPRAIVGHEYVLNPEPNISGEAWLVLPQWEKTKSQFAKKNKRRAPPCPYCRK